MFAFDKDVRKSFKRVQRDVSALKESVNGWVVFLNGNQRELKVRVAELERRLAAVEARQEKREVEQLRGL